MPDYTRAQLLEAVRTDHPEFRKIDDNKLFAAIAQDHPDLAQGISELHPPEYQSPAPPKTAGDVALDQMESVGQGVKNLPGSVMGILQNAFRVPKP